MVGFAGFGAAYAFLPTTMAALAEVELPSPTARIDYVATYGGLQLGFAVFLWHCARRPDGVAVGLSAGWWALLGLALARAGALVVNGGNARPVVYWGLALETVGAGLAFWGAALLHRKQIDPIGPSL